MRVRSRTFTDEQAAAIDRRDRSLLLSAAAGSGKTTVLVERFVRSVLDDGIAAGVDSRDHLHRQGGRGAARAGPCALPRARRAAAGAARPRRRGSRRSTASARACCAAIAVSAGARAGLRRARRADSARAAGAGLRDRAREAGSTRASPAPRRSARPGCGLPARPADDDGARDLRRPARRRPRAATAATATQRRIRGAERDALAVRLRRGAGGARRRGGQAGRAGARA